MINSLFVIYEDFHYFFLEIITDLIKYLGQEKVYLSIFNNNSTRTNLNILYEWLIVNNVNYIFDRNELFNKSNYQHKEKFLLIRQIMQ